MFTDAEAREHNVATKMNYRLIQWNKFEQHGLLKVKWTVVAHE